MQRLSFRDRKKIPTLTFLVGVPASGKSSWINSHKNEGFVVVEPDAIRREITGNVSDQKQNDEVWKIAKENIIKALKDNRDVVLDATNVKIEDRRQVLENLPECNLRAIIFNCNPRQSMERIQKALEKGQDRADVPYGAILKMCEFFKNECSPEQLKSEGFEVEIFKRHDGQQHSKGK